MTLAPSPPMGPPTLSDNTQAVLLLTSPLLSEGSGTAGGAKVLTAKEYSQLAISLLQMGHQPADLLNGARETILSVKQFKADSDRLNHLLSRGFQLSQAIEHWANRSITVISRADQTYPRRYKQRLRHLAPPLLYACGNLELLNRPTLAVVGSRSTPEALLQQTEQIGALAAAAGVVITSGAAKGVDEAAMLGALQAGGFAIGVVADSLEKMSAKAIWRQALIEGRLLLLSAEPPNARFQVWRAMGRNKLIYALADSALVMSSAKESGGTWDGAEEQLTKLKSCVVHVVDDPRGGEGLPALHAMGAPLWPYPSTPDQLRAVLSAQPAINQASSSSSAQRPPNPQPEAVQESLLDARTSADQHATPAISSAESPVANGIKPTQLAPSTTDEPAASASIPAPATPAEQLLALANTLLIDALDEPKTEDDLEQLLGVTKTQIKQWCKRLISDGLIRRMNKPIRYVKR